MNIQDFYANEQEKPLDRLVEDGGFCGIFHNIACIGDSLSSGEFESEDADGTKHYVDMYPYSWGQYIARMTGATVYNFSRGGMCADAYCETFAAEQDFWNADKKCQCYIIALGVNDFGHHDYNLGTIADVDFSDWRKNKKTFAGYYAQIIQRYKEIQPQAKFFLMTVPKTEDTEEKRKNAEEAHRTLLYAFAEKFDNTYVLDFRKYAPVYDAEFKRNFYLLGHLNPMGYMLTAKMTASYIDYIVRNNPQDFKQVGLIGTEYYMNNQNL